MLRLERGNTLLFGFEIVGNVLELGLGVAKRIELFGSRTLGVSFLARCERFARVLKFGFSTFELIRDASVFLFKGVAFALGFREVAELVVDGAFFGLELADPGFDFLDVDLMTSV
ncbi:hypothetical protein [Halalkalicoccus jeotgali]|uniref:Uncharacterized protein n=1 Tax=Halalkalicoccus jeotgali (strain DSM 18796 / CECT 7217 / JCM 14584 / KCTC 4019 / B3) TaxID=795797 RepID=D8JCP5_HALJB|nr:hypothetical protein [Halalkalicoccus jeotgali]ADJ17152.1 hypothetical protein HacjB3_19073 [Halalkalicoccus jeotgali B3]ELY41693.1 hypothetical protein C497_00350 [Halalkalicoccus jeotgali B3]